MDPSDSGADRPASAGADAAYAALAAAHSGLDRATSERLDRRLVLHLAEAVGDASRVAEAAQAARRGLAPAAAPDGVAVLHDFARSSACWRVRIALGLKGVAFERIGVDLRAGAHRTAGHLARNPQGLVPVLEIDGHSLTQSLAIIAYLDETRPEPPLMPRTPAERPRLTAVAHAVAMEIAPICNRSVAARAAEMSGGGEGAMAAWMRHFIGRGLAAVETMLDHPATGPFAHGARPGLADCCIVPQLYNARAWGVPLDALPRLLAIEAACAALPAFAAAHPDATTR